MFDVSEAETLIKTIVPEIDTPVYVVLTSRLPDEFTAIDATGYTQQDLDLVLRPHSSNWQGRGPAVVVDDRKVAADNEEWRDLAEVWQLSLDELLRRRLLGLVLHEFAHKIPVGRLPDLGEETVQQASTKIKTHCSTGRTIEPAVGSEDFAELTAHHAWFYRVCSHLLHRSRRVVDMRPYFITPKLGMFADALRDEVVELERWRFADIRRIDPPVRFSCLWQSYLTKWARERRGSDDPILIDYLETITRGC